MKLSPGALEGKTLERLAALFRACRLGNATLDTRPLTEEEVRRSHEMFSEGEDRPQKAPGGPGSGHLE